MSAEVLNPFFKLLKIYILINLCILKHFKSKNISPCMQSKAS